MKIAFHSNQLGFRGTEVSLYNYAKYNEEILGNESIVISDKYADHGIEAYDKFKQRFPTFLYTDSSQIQSICEDNNIDVFYAQKSGQIDNKNVNGIKNVVHAIFRYCQPHGDVYSYISEWLASYMKWPSFVPYIVEPLPFCECDLREDLNIPKNSIVYGFHGGRDSFNIDFVKKSVVEVATEYNDIYFVFLNIDKFCDLKNVIFLPGTYELGYKSKFINTCDAMLHARFGGETFGLSVAEFSSKNKPVITYGSSVEAAHIHMLGDVGIYYNNESELRDILLNFDKIDLSKNYDVYTERFSPEKVMEKFKLEFLS